MMMGLALITQEIRLPSESAILKMDVESNQQQIVFSEPMIVSNLMVPANEN